MSIHLGHKSMTALDATTVATVVDHFVDRDSDAETVVPTLERVLGPQFLEG